MRRFYDLDLDAAINSFIYVFDDSGFATCYDFTNLELKCYFADHLCSVTAAMAEVKIMEMRTAHVKINDSEPFLNLILLS